MSFQQELSSWWAPKSTTPLAQSPSIGSQAPQTSQLPTGANNNSQAAILVFLRHCGCPFAEKTFLNLRSTARHHKSISFYAISHSSEQSTQTWLASLPQHGSELSNLHIIVDESLDLYAAWGLGLCSYSEVVSPWALLDVWKLGRDEGIWNRATESGSRWQQSGVFAVDGEGIVRWGGAAQMAGEIPDFEEAVEVLE